MVNLPLVWLLAYPSPSYTAVKLYVLELYVDGIVYSSTASPPATLACSVFPFLSVNVFPFNLNTTFPRFILSPFASTIFAHRVIVSPDFTVNDDLSNDNLAMPSMIFSMLLDLLLLEV